MIASDYAATFKPFACYECGGNVVLTKGPGRTMELYRSVPELELHESFALPQCEKCGEIYVPGALHAELRSHLRGRFDLLVWERLNALEEFVLSRAVLPQEFFTCRSCLRPATRELSQPTSTPWWRRRHACDRCYKDHESRDLKQAPLLRKLARLRGDDG